MVAINVLKEYFGHEDFRSGQKELIDAITAGIDAVGIMPTGGGKSICYQVPSIIFEGITIVISPLISLMKDQIHGLTQSGVSAAYINSTLSEIQVDKVLQNARNGKYKIIYIAPERLISPRFLEFCYSSHIPFVAVDEAHCVSQWGQDFRPSYSSIPDFIDKFEQRPVVAAFTATATEIVREDIVRILKLKTPKIVINSFDRKNLFFEVRHAKKGRYEALKNILSAKKDQYGIVYCSTRKAVEEVCKKLQDDNFNVGKYHAGLSDSERHSSQDDFIFDRIKIVVATNAFGMGIDKSNVSFVIHYNMPKDIESYYQEAGRAGRDGNNAECILLYNGQDLRTNLFLIENSEGRYYESEEQKIFLQSKERARLKAIETYCNTSSCLRKYILNYFGENIGEACGNCGSCLDETEETDITVLAQKILSCIVRTKEFYGRNMIIDILRGSKSDKIIRSGLADLPTYGICKEAESDLKEVIGFLAEHEYICYTSGQYPIMKLGKNAERVLKDKECLSMRRSVKDKADSKQGSVRKKLDLAGGVQDEALLSMLKALRRRIADEQNVPAYIVFSDRTLIEMCEKLPITLAAFAEISGVGKVKIETYGSIFIDCINNYLKENNIEVSVKTHDIDIIIDSVNIGIEADANPLLLKDFLPRINEFLERLGIKKITSKIVNDWLTAEGLLESMRDEQGRLKRILTPIGIKYEMRVEERLSASGDCYNVLLYSSKVQQYVINNLKSLLIFRNKQ